MLDLLIQLVVIMGIGIVEIASNTINKNRHPSNQQAPLERQKDSTESSEKSQNNNTSKKSPKHQSSQKKSSNSKK